MSLLDYEHRFSQLKLNTRGGGEKSPHKVAMMLAVIELLEKDGFTDPRIFFNADLKNKFTRKFNDLAGPKDRNNPHLPYFHLRSSGFWHHHLKPGKSSDYEKLTTVSGPGMVNEVIEYAFLDDELVELLRNEFARTLLKKALLQSLTVKNRQDILRQENDWNWLEHEMAVQSYFKMLHKDVSGQKYGKRSQEQEVLTKLNGRSADDLQNKFKNISAFLVQLGQPYLKAYQPILVAEQERQLFDVVLAYIAAHQKDFEQLSKIADSDVQESLPIIDWDAVLDVNRPAKIPSVKEPPRNYLARQINFSERERRNRKLGLQGEEFVLQYERYRLEKAGRADLAREVEWQSQSLGDGLGYDIRSFNHEKDQELYIEVKTTRSGKFQPFFISDAELEFSKAYSSQYALYRVYEFNTSNRLFDLPGAVDQYVHLRVNSYKASFG